MIKTFFFCVLLVCFSASQPGIDDDPVSYLQWMQQSLPDVPEWTAWQQKTGELPPNFDQLPRSNLLPDPLRFLDGRTVKNNIGVYIKYF